MVATLFKIDKETLKKSENCRKRCSCLCANKRDICAIDFCVGKEIYFVKFPDGKPCPNMNTFGKGNICECPVRKELYDKYQI
jgi:hypothetical protein